MTINMYDDKSTGAIAYEALAKEVIALDKKKINPGRKINMSTVRRGNRGLGRGLGNLIPGSSEEEKGKNR